MKARKREPDPLWWNQKSCGPERFQRHRKWDSIRLRCAARWSENYESQPWWPKFKIQAKPLNQAKLKEMPKDPRARVRELFFRQGQAAWRLWRSLIRRSWL